MSDNGRCDVNTSIGTRVKTVWVCFSLFALLLAPLSQGQAQVMDVENTNMTHHQNSMSGSLHATHLTASASSQHDCCTEQFINDVLIDSCESIDCEHDCANCLGSCSYFATLGLDTADTLYLPLTNSSGYRFSLQVIVASPQTPPPNASSFQDTPVYCAA